MGLTPETDQQGVPGIQEKTIITGKAQENGYDCGLELWKREDKEEDWYPSICLLQEKPAWENICVF